MSKVEWEVRTNEQDKCLDFHPFKMKMGFIPVPHCGRRKATNPHMRAFWAATLAFMLAFIGWFAFAPLMTVVRKDIGVCDNDAAVQMDIENTKCVCKKDCKTTLGNAKMASVSFDVFTRFILGSVIEVMGPKNTDVMLLLFGSLFVSSGLLITNGTGLIIVRFFVSCLGSTFVVNQFWNSIMFDSSVVGTANATAGGWGNLEESLRHSCLFSTGSGMMVLDSLWQLHGDWRCSSLLLSTLVSLFGYSSFLKTPRKASSIQQFSARRPKLDL
jgi:nitrate/nitrite transporter NarK